MDFPSQTIIDVLTYLLPGFITAALFYSLTPAPKPIPFERVVQALIFTILIQASLFSVGYGLFWSLGHSPRWGPLGDGVRTIWAVGLAVVWGGVVAWALNSDRIHRVLRRWGITHQTSYASEWYGAFCRNEGYVVLHLKGERRLLGWAEEWPSTPDVGHFVMSRAQWLREGEEQPIDLTAVHRVLIRATDVEMVEMMKLITNEENHGR